jgi:enoyl-CoA hydratase/carnithine racemase
LSSSSDTDQRCFPLWRFRWPTLYRSDRVQGTITLDHERRRNALSHALVEEVITALNAFREASVRVVILRAKPGAKVFSAGHDVDELPESRRDPLGWDDPLRQLVREIENYPGPVIAMVEGSVWGGATETVFACDLIVAAETATFAVTPAKLGLPYNVSGGGRVDERALARHAASEADIHEALRSAGLEETASTRRIVLEPSGKISVLKNG